MLRDLEALSGTVRGQAADISGQAARTAAPGAPPSGRAAAHCGLELAFYGGSFTALPMEWIMRFLKAAARFRQTGIVTAVRCSTRPDACDPALLELLAARGLDMVELGVQTFDDAVLDAVGRGHSVEDSRRAARAVKNAGLELGLHLLPGLPGHDEGGLANDVAECAALGPSMVRLHPCLVLAGTGLEALWREGRFVPWPLERMAAALARASLALWTAGIATGRVGLAREPSLEGAVLAGPRHPALGTMARAGALLEHIKSQAAGRQPARLIAPQSVSGELFGHGRELAGEYASLGLGPGRVLFEDRTDFILEFA
jgi:histone acetyltransferase (RNA polymerase elongator complex component)